MITFSNLGFIWKPRDIKTRNIAWNSIRLGEVCDTRSRNLSLLFLNTRFARSDSIQRIGLSILKMLSDLIANFPIRQQTCSISHFSWFPNCPIWKYHILWMRKEYFIWVFIQSFIKILSAQLISEIILLAMQIQNGQMWIAPLPLLENT